MPKRIPTAEGAVLRCMRTRKGVDQDELAAMEGVSTRTIERWENGKLTLERERLVKVLSHLGVPPEAVEAALLADELANPPGRKGSGPEEGLIERATAAGARAGAKAARAELRKRQLLRKAPLHRQWARERWLRLKSLEAREQEMAIDALLGDERSWVLAEKICLASTTAAAKRADEALRLARLAHRLAEHVPDEDLRPLLLGWVKPFLANAQMIGGNHADASQTLAHADSLWAEGGAGLLDTARRLDLKISVLTGLGKFDEVQSLIAKALTGAPTPHPRGRLLLKKARALEAAGEYEVGLKVLAEAKPLLETQQDRRLLLSYHFTRVVFHCHLEFYGAAETLLLPVEALIDPDNELDGVRLDWLRGRVWAGIGHRQEAVAALARVRDYFHAEAIAYDCAVVSVELGTVLLEEGRAPEVRELAEEMMWIFKSQGIHEKALEALALFCHAAKAEQAQTDLARRLVKYLYRAQNNPALKFQPW